MNQYIQAIKCTNTGAFVHSRKSKVEILITDIFTGVKHLRFFLTQSKLLDLTYQRINISALARFTDLVHFWFQDSNRVSFNPSGLEGSVRLPVQHFHFYIRMQKERLEDIVAD